MTKSLPTHTSSTDEIIGMNHVLDNTYSIHTIIYNQAGFKEDTMMLEGAECIDYKEGTIDGKEDLLFDNSLASISAINSRNKYSTGYYVCTAILAIGKDARTGENISFLTHQNPIRFLDYRFEDEKVRFLEGLINALKDLIVQSVPGTIDVVIAGGAQGLYESENYIQGILMLEKVINETISFSPVVVGGPSAYGNNAEKDIFLDTKTRTVSVFRDHSKSNNTISFVASEAYRLAGSQEDN